MQSNSNPKSNKKKAKNIKVKYNCGNSGITVMLNDLVASSVFVNFSI